MSSSLPRKTPIFCLDNCNTGTDTTLNRNDTKTFVSFESRHLKADRKGCCVQNSITVVIRGWGHEAGEECDPLWSGGGPAGLRGPLRTCRGKTGRRQQGYSVQGPQWLLCFPGVHVFQDMGHCTPCPRPGGAARAPSLLGAHQSEPSVHPGTSGPFSQPLGVFLQ